MLSSAFASLQKFLSDQQVPQGILLSFLLSWLALFFETSILSSLTSLAFIGLRLALGRRKIFQSQIFLGLLSILSLLFVLMQFGRLSQSEPLANLVLILTAIRFLSVSTQSKESFMLLLLPVLLCMKFIFNVDLIWVPIGLLNFWIILKEILGREYSGKVLIQLSTRGIPLAFVMFLLFPRLVVMPLSSGRDGFAKGKTGFSDTISAGDTSSIQNDTKVAFRSEITSRQNSRELYWRLSVLDRGQGFSWSRSPASENASRPQPINTPNEKNRSLSFKIIIESEEINYVPLINKTSFVKVNDRTLIPNAKGSISINNFIEKYPILIESVGETDGKEEGPLPIDGLYLNRLDEKTRKWAEDRQALSDSQKISEIQKLFQNGFIYTRNPGSYRQENGFAEFLWVRRKGYCEHFATAFATLSRALGIPSRVLVGFQGGQWINGGQFLIVRNSDAHAWNEVFLDGRWKRVDPTEWVAPLRMEIGATEFLSLSPEDTLLSFEELKEKRKQGFQIQALWSWIQDSWDTLNYHWLNFVIGLDINSQRKWLDEIKDFSFEKIATILGLIGLLIVGLILGLRNLNFARDQQQKLKMDLLAFEKKLSRKSIYRKPNQPPISFLDSLSLADRALMQQRDQLKQRILSAYGRG